MIVKSFITKRQKQLLWFIYRHVKTDGYPPTFEEIRDELNVSSNQAVIDLLNQLENKKFIKRESSARGIKILEKGFDTLSVKQILPLLGTTAAGFPIDAVETEGEWRKAGENLDILKNDVYLLKIKGDSMINADIENGDMVLVKSDSQFASGNIVLADIGGKFTVKRFMSIDKPPFLYLKPENPKYDIIHFTEDVTLKGKVISVIKNTL